MDRITEPELMNDFEQAFAYANADFDEPHSMFIEKFRETYPDEILHKKILDLGCGTADISIRFARMYPRCMIDGVDGADSMLSFGNTAIEKNKFGQRIKLIRGVLPDIKLPHEKYDVIISNSLLHHLHNPDVLWKVIKKFGSNGTKVFIMDLYRPDSKQAAMAIVDCYAKDEPEILQRDFYNSLCAAFNPEEIKQQLSKNGLDFLQLKIASDRHVLITGQLDAQ